MIKKLLTFVAVLAMCFSCYDDSKIWDTLTDHESRISALEKLCKEMNTNISSLQGLVQSLQQNEYITKVIAVVENEFGFHAKTADFLLKQRRRCQAVLAVDGVNIAADLENTRRCVLAVEQLLL